jgi:hypothetical protein
MVYTDAEGQGPCNDHLVFFLNVEFWQLHQETAELALVTSTSQV